MYCFFVLFFSGGGLHKGLGIENTMKVLLLDKCTRRHLGELEQDE